MVNTKEITDLNERFVRNPLGNGGINNEELEILIRFYDDLCRDSEILDSAFSLFRKELYSRYDVLKGFKAARIRPLQDDA